MRDDIATLTIREWMTLRILAREPTSSIELRRLWGGLRYRGKIHDVLYRLEQRGYAIKASADYHATGTSWRLSERGEAVQAEVHAMLTGLSRRR